MIRDEVREGRLVLTLERMDKANALTEAMLVALAERVEALHRGSEIGALVLTGAGKVFSAGADLDEVRGGDLATSPAWERLSVAVAEAPVVTVAALNGSCAGGALGMVLACDLRVSVPEATFFYPVMKMGVLPQPSDPGRLSTLVGPSRAKLLLLGGARVDAREALAIGLVDRLVADPLVEAITLTEAVVGADRDRVTAIRQMISPR